MGVVFAEMGVPRTHCGVQYNDACVIVTPALAFQGATLIARWQVRLALRQERVWSHSYSLLVATFMCEVTQFALRI